ncbi:MAG: hypothetical protein AAF483_28260, partial [Planctomycetota bacterium]
MVKIPNRLEDLYPASAVEKILEALQQPDLSGKVKETLGKVGLGELNPIEQVQHAWQQAKSWLHSMTSDEVGSDTALINATGELISPGLGPVPCSNAIAQIILQHGTQFQDASRHENLLTNVLENAFESNGFFAVNVASALRTLVGSKTVYIAKTDLVRIPGLGNVASMLQGLPTQEVGPANGCSRDDWQMALLEADTSESCVLVVSPNTLASDAATAQCDATISVAQEKGVPIFRLVANATLHQTLADTLKFPKLDKEFVDKSSAVLAPLDLLLGAPTGAVVLGHSEFVERANLELKSSGASLKWPFVAAACVALQLQDIQEEPGSGPLNALLANSENLRDRAERIAIQLNENGVVRSAQSIERISQLGPAPWNHYELKNWAVELQFDEPLKQIEEKLAAG